MLERLSFLTLAAFITLCSCGGTSVNQACTDFANARCSKRASCGMGNLSRAYGDVATCIAREKLSCTRGLNAPSTGNSPSATEACAIAWANVSCADFIVGNAPPACVYTGGLAAGASCVFNGQCSTTYCVDQKVTTCGTCGPAPTGSCATTNCARGMECINNVCVTPAMSGAPCDDNNPCQPGLSCVGAKMNLMGNCQPAVATEGASCVPGATTGPGCDPVQGLYCASNKTCQPIAYVGDAMPCGLLSDGSFAACAANGTCIIPTGMKAGVCKGAAADGAACDTSAGPNCLQPARCVTGGNGTAGTCQVPDASKC